MKKPALLDRITSLGISRWVYLSFIANLLISIAVLPTFVSPQFFDNTSATQFIVLVGFSFVFFIIILTKNGLAKLGKFELTSLIILILAVLISTLLSQNYLGSLTGDTQRYTGAISLFALIIFLIFNSNVILDQSKYLLIGLLITISVVTLLGLLQFFNLVSISGAGGTSSTLGNPDFLSAWIGTTIPLFLIFAHRKFDKKTILIISIGAISLFLLLKIGPKQGLIDLFLALIATLGYWQRNRILSLHLSKNLSKLLIGLVAFVWVEVVLLIPFQKTNIPWITNDPNVKIRTQYWISALNTFLHNLSFGVGPDNYGNYYQQYRTLTSVRLEENVMSNDAHSSVFQTLATLGIFGSLAFLLLWTLLARAMWTNFKKYPEHRKMFYFLATFFVIYATNSMISPIPLPHKVLFWSLAGLAFGLAYQNEVENSKTELELRDELSFKDYWENISVLTIRRIFQVLISVLMVLSLLIGSTFAVGEVKFIRSINDLKTHPHSSAVRSYKYNSIFPCTYYFLTQRFMANQVSAEKELAFAEAEVSKSPRCVDARVFLTDYYTKVGENGKASQQLQELMKIAPANRQVLILIGNLAQRLEDKGLMKMLHDHEVKLGFIK